MAQRDDYPAPNSLYADYGLLPELPGKEARERDLRFFGRFDALLSDACFRGDIVLTARRPGAAQVETVPNSYFFKPRGFSYFSGSKIDDTPANASIDAILENAKDGGWEDAILEREHFLTWFARIRSTILGDGVVATSPSQTTAPAKDCSETASAAELPKRGSRAAAKREWEAEIQGIKLGAISRRTQKEIEADYLSRFNVSREELRDWIRGTRPVGRPPKTKNRNRATI